MVGVSHNSVKALRKVLVESGRLWPELSLLDDHQWRSVLNNHDKSVAQKKITPDWNWPTNKCSARTGRWKSSGWREGCPEGVGYSAFTEHYRRWKKSLISCDATAPRTRRQTFRGLRGQNSRSSRPSWRAVLCTDFRCRPRLLKSHLFGGYPEPKG